MFLDIPMITLGALVGRTAIVAAPAAQSVGEAERSVEAILDELRGRRHKKLGYYDLHHGYPEPDVVALMNARFASTEPVIAELEWLDRQPSMAQDDSYRSALYDVLAIVKDPRSIPWIEERARSERAAEVYVAWLRRWLRFPHGQNFAERAWLEEEGRWADCLCTLADIAAEPIHRLTALQALQQWFTDEATVGYFMNLRHDDSLTPEQSLVVEHMLFENGRAADPERLQASIDALGNDPDGRLMLTGVANYMRHERFAAWLSTTTDFADLYTLSRITLNRTIEVEEGAEDSWRRSLVSDYFDAIFELCRRDPDAAAERLGKDMYKMDCDPLVAEHLLEAADHRALDDLVCVLVKFVYRPHLRGELQATADKILSRHPGGDGLEPWAYASLQEVGLAPGARSTWEQVVVEAIR